jgi:hypothetical protein
MLLQIIQFQKKEIQKSHTSEEDSDTVYIAPESKLLFATKNKQVEFSQKRTGRFET